MSRPPKNALLRQARLQRHWSQQELADRVGSTVANISRWERNVTTPGAYFRQQLCTILEMSHEELAIVLPLSLHEPALTIWSVPVRRNPFFTGRDDILLQIRSQFLRGSHMAQALSGLAGIGKTQIALEYAFRFREEYRAVFWLAAETLEQFQRTFITIAHTVDIPEKADIDYQACFNAVQHWLCQQDHWLMVLDNIENLSEIAPILPANHAGHILLTSRSPITGTFAPTQHIPPMTPQEGMLFLLRRSKVAYNTPYGDTYREQARAISQVLDGLPLALDQAGAYIEETGCELLGYLKRLDIHLGVLLSRRGLNFCDHPQSVRATFSLTHSYIANANLLAHRILQLSAFFPPDAIPEELIECYLNQDAQLPIDEMQIDAAIGLLRSYSLIHRSVETNMLSIHRLVQAVLLAEMEPETKQQYASEVLHVVAEAYPDGKDVTQWSLCQRYLPFVWTVVLAEEQVLIADSLVISMIVNAATFLLLQNNFVQATTLLDFARDRQEHNNPECSMMARILKLQCQVAMGQTRLSEAYHFIRRAIAIWERMGGLDHADGAMGLNWLGVVYSFLYQYKQATSFFQHALRIQQQILGADHPDTAFALSNLACILHRQQHYEQAEALYLQSLAIREKELGIEHPDVTLSLYSLAELYVQQNRMDEAESLCQRAIAIRIKTTGERHAVVAICAKNLAILYLATSRFQQADYFCCQALRLHEEIWGPENIQMAHCLEICADVFDKLARDKEAIDLRVRAKYIRNEYISTTQAPLYGIVSRFDS